MQIRKEDKSFLYLEADRNWLKKVSHKNSYSSYVLMVNSPTDQKLLLNFNYSVLFLNLLIFNLQVMFKS